MFVVQILLLIVTFLSLISSNLSLMQTTKVVNPHPRIVTCVNMWSVTFLIFFFFSCCHLLNIDACICHIVWEGQVEWTTPHHTTPLKCCTFVLFHSVTCYTNSTVSRIHINTIRLRNITCALVATGVTLRSVECTSTCHIGLWLWVGKECVPTVLSPLFLWVWVSSFVYSVAHIIYPKKWCI